LRQAGVWDQIMGALAARHDVAVQMIDTSVVRLHQHGACIADNNHQDITITKIWGAHEGSDEQDSRGGVTNGLPSISPFTPGETHDKSAVFGSLSALASTNDVTRGSWI